MYQEDEQIQVKRRRSEQAVKLAMARRWEDAVAANKAILDVFPNDTDSYNRMGKALMELGKFPAAKKAYKNALDLDPGNQIAKKNLERVAIMAKATDSERTSQADPSLFIEEMGKSVLTIVESADAVVLQKLSAGDEVKLVQKKDELSVQTLGGSQVGAIEQKLRKRIIKLMDGGSQYAAAVTSLEGGQCKIIIKEIHRDPRQVGPSFPTAITTEKLRPYTKDRLVKNSERSSRADDMEPEDTGSDDDSDSDGWDDDSLAQEGHLSINDAAEAEDEAEAPEDFDE